jgi:peptidoglycan/xylan/chitin deacetylase (PgdA/CDA1 family)
MPVTRVAGNGERGPAERASGHDERARALAENGRVFFTTSWDDGHPLDQRVADLLHKHGLTGTFYVPARVGSGGAGDADVFSIMPGEALRALAAQFEVGSHTFDHRRLDELPLDEARRQVVAGKQWLEDQLGARVPGFCYPYGSHNAAVRGIVRDSGFDYGRVAEDLHGGLPEDPFELPVSLHLYPRSRAELARRFVSEERRRLGAWRWPRRLRMLLASVAEEDLAARARRLIDRVCARGGVLHLWGHSWEIDRFGGWGMLESVFAYAGERLPAGARVTNAEVAQAAAAARAAR